MNAETVLGILIATIAATVLKWAANRWPSADEKRRRLRQARIDELEDRKRIRELEAELETDSAQVDDRRHVRDLEGQLEDDDDPA